MALGLSLSVALVVSALAFSLTTCVAYATVVAIRLLALLSLPFLVP